MDILVVIINKLSIFLFSEIIYYLFFLRIFLIKWIGKELIKIVKCFLG